MRRWDDGTGSRGFICIEGRREQRSAGRVILTVGGHPYFFLIAGDPAERHLLRRAETDAQPGSAFARH
jgi:hypothetical protein